MTEDHKDVNNRFQGTLHKVSGPLNRDVQQMRSDLQNPNALAEG
jgi:hypothetical protein